LSTKLFGLCSDESIISHRMILKRYSLFGVYFQSYMFTGIIGVVFFISIFIQAFYNYKRWKNEIEE
ncbi:hypothetical protein WKT17_15565, partial [Blautia sp. HCN-20427]